MRYALFKAGWISVVLVSVAACGGSGAESVDAPGPGLSIGFERLDAPAAGLAETYDWSDDTGAVGVDIDALAIAVYAEDWRVRESAVDQLAMLGTSEAVLLLTPLLDDPDPDLRFDVLNALYEIGDDTARAYIEQTSSHADEELREEAQAMLGNWQR